MALTFAGAAGAQEGDAERGAAGGWLREVRGGVLAHDLDGLWSGSQAEAGVDASAELIFAAEGLRLPWGSLHPNLGASVNLSGDTSKLYAGILWELRSAWGLFLDLGVGAAVHDGKLDERRGDRKALGSRVLFRLPIEIGYELRRHHRLMVTFAHVSNAGLADPNQGLDVLGVRYGHRF